MKKKLQQMIIAVLAVIATMAAPKAQATDIYDRTAMGTIAANGTWTNTVLFGSIQLKRISFTAMAYATDTVTVRRVTAATATDTKVLTNTVVTAVCSSSGAASNLTLSADSGPEYMKYGDMLTFTSGMGSNGYYYIEYLKQPR